MEKFKEIEKEHEMFMKIEKRIKTEKEQEMRELFTKEELKKYSHWAISKLYDLRKKEKEIQQVLSVLCIQLYEARNNQKSIIAMDIARKRKQQ